MAVKRYHNASPFGPLDETGLPKNSGIKNMSVPKAGFDYEYKSSIEEIDAYTKSDIKSVVIKPRKVQGTIMPQMVRSKKSQKVLNNIIGKPDAMKRPKKTKTEEEVDRKTNMADYYRRDYGKQYLVWGD